MKSIGIVGVPSSGKGEMAQYIMDKKDNKTIYVGNAGNDFIKTYGKENLTARDQQSIGLLQICNEKGIKDFKGYDMSVTTSPVWTSEAFQKMYHSKDELFKGRLEKNEELLRESKYDVILLCKPQGSYGHNVKEINQNMGLEKALEDTIVKYHNSTLVIMPKDIDLRKSTIDGVIDVLNGKYNEP